jgi:hypothetical protein
MIDMIDFRRNEMSLGTILLIVVVLLLIGAIPAWPHSRSWGYGPSGGIGLVVLILIILLLTAGCSRLPGFCLPERTQHIAGGDGDETEAGLRAHTGP